MMVNSLKFKLTVLIVLAMGINTLAIGAILKLTFDRNIQLLTRQTLKNARDVFNHLEKNSTRVLSSTLTALLENNDLRKIFITKNRKALLKKAAPLFEKFKNNYHITHWYFIYPETARPQVARRCFLRVHTPEKYNDIINRFTYRNAVKTKTYAAGKELGKTAFALRVVHPYYQGNKLIGYMELGQEIDDFLSDMKKQTGADFALLVKKKYLDKGDWASVRETKGLQNNWDSMKDVLVVDNTYENESIYQYGNDIEKLPDEGKVLGYAKVEGQDFTRSIFPIYDAGHRKVGGIFVLYNITHIQESLKSAFLYSILSVAGISLILMLVIIVFLNKLILKRLGKVTRAVTLLVGGDYETRIEPSGDDEIGKFEKLFERFRTVFANAIHEVEKLQHGDK